MSMTITLTDDLAGELRMQAQTRQLSVEQWAVTILGHAAENPDELRSWANLHRRRFDLIQERYSTGLDRAEEVKLKQLQDSVAKVLEPADRRMLDALYLLDTNILSARAWSPTTRRTSRTSPACDWRTG